MRESSQVKEMRGSSQVNVMRESSQVKEMRGSSQVKEMWGSSQVNVMWGSSQVNVMRESSQVKEMRESSQVNVMRESSQVKEMRESSQVNVMRESSQVNVMRESSQVNVMWESSQVTLYGESMVSAYGTNKITCHGYNVVRTSKKNKKNLILKLSKDSHLILIPEFKPSFAEYVKRYPVEFKSKTTAILYKAVHKRDGKFLSNHTLPGGGYLEYVPGEVIKHECDPSKEVSCTKGLHVSHLSWAKDFGRGWADLAILEVEVPVSKIVVGKDCDGKVRTSQLKVIKEITI
jgi:hypothetical protein